MDVRAPFRTKRNVWECGSCALLKARQMVPLDGDAGGLRLPDAATGGEIVPKVSQTYPRKEGAELPGLLNAANLKTGPATLTVASAAEKLIKGEKKLVLGFKERKEQLICNVTNARTLSERYGDDTDAWVGQSVQLVVVPVSYQGKSMPGIRIAG